MPCRQYRDVSALLDADEQLNDLLEHADRERTRSHCRIADFDVEQCLLKARTLPGRKAYFCRRRIEGPAMASLGRAGVPIVATSAS